MKIRTPYHNGIHSASDYYPFGMLEPGRNFPTVTDTYRYGFNGQMKVNDIYTTAVGSEYDFGARMYDARLGRWWSNEPFKTFFPGESPFSFSLNTPIQAADPDGQLVIFVNGFRVKAFVTETLLCLHDFLLSSTYRIFRLSTKSSFDRSDYWCGVDDRYMDRVNDHHSMYIDGMGDGPKSKAKTRYQLGVVEADQLIKKFVTGEIVLQPGETINIVGHSHGAAFAAGMADRLAECGFPVMSYIAIAPHQPNQFSLKQADKIPIKLQYSRASDKVSTTGYAWEFGRSWLKKIEGIPDDGFHLCDNIEEDQGGHYINTYLSEIFVFQSKRPLFVIPTTIRGPEIKSTRSPNSKNDTETQYKDTRHL